MVFAFVIRAWHKHYKNFMQNELNQVPRQNLKIIDLNDQGIGIADIDGQSITVPFSLPGETCNSDVFHITRQTQIARIHTIMNDHPQRVSPQCIHYGICGGCVLQHCSTLFYEQFKLDRLRQYLSDHNVKYTSLEPLISIGPYQRRRIDFMGKKILGDVVLGFHQRLTKKRFNTKHCLVIDPDLNAIFDPLRTVFTEILQEGELIHVFATKADNGIDLLLAGLKRHFIESDISLLRALCEPLKLTRLVYKVKTKAYEIYRREIPYVIIAGYPIEISSYCFLQASKKSDQVLADNIIRLIGERVQNIADLFCGRGTLSLPLIQQGHYVTGYECDPHGLIVLNNLNIANLTVHQRNLFEQPLLIDELGTYDAIVINPPRAGALDQCQQLSNANTILQIIYVSCNPETFARDAAVLQAGGYKLNTIIPFDQFLWSPHLEVIGHFQRP